MKQKELETLRRDETSSIEKKCEELRKQLASLIVELRTSPQKDSNIIHKKRKELSVLLTILREKQIYGKTT